MSDQGLIVNWDNYKCPDCEAKNTRIAELEAEVERRKWVAPAEMNAKNRRIEQLEAALREITAVTSTQGWRKSIEIARAALDSCDS